jgi:hypothetical protein
MIYLTQTFWNPAWLRQDIHEYHLMFYSLKKYIPIHKSSAWANFLNEKIVTKYEIFI